MNGCLLFERMDGTKNEIAKELREQNIFIFGERVEGMN
jgi:glucan phosphorylase